MLYGIVAATTAFLLAAFLAALIRPCALRLGLVDRRRTRRVPALGGLAVAGATCVVAFAGDWTGVAPLGTGVGKLLAAGGAVALLGVVADVWRLKTRFLLFGTAVAAACVVPYGEFGTAGGLLGAGWIAFVAVAFKGLDHADGLAGTVGVVTAFGAGACAAAEVMDGLAALLSVLAAALTGFLMHNWAPARIALGATGSLFTGFVLAAAALVTRTGYDPAASAGVLFALTAVASADVLLVVLSRVLAGRPVLRRGPDHLAHRLRRLGLTSQGATVVLGAASFAGVLPAVLVHTGWTGPAAVAWAVGVTLVVVLGLLGVPVYGPRRPTGAHTIGRQTAGRQTDVPTGRRQTGVHVSGRHGQLSGTVRRADHHSPRRPPEYSAPHPRQPAYVRISAPARVRNG